MVSDRPPVHMINFMRQRDTGELEIHAIKQKKLVTGSYWNQTVEAEIYPNLADYWKIRLKEKK